MIIKCILREIDQETPKCLCKFSRPSGFQVMAQNS